MFTEDQRLQIADIIRRLVHWVGRRIFVSDCPFEFSESQRFKLLHKDVVVAITETLLTRAEAISDWRIWLFSFLIS